MYPNLRSKNNEHHGSNVVGAQRQKIRVILALILLACYHNTIIVWTYLLWVSLLLHHCSPLQELYDAGDESSFLRITGLTQEVFDALLHVIIPPGHVICHPRRGRQWSLPPDGMLGLLLCFLGSQMSNKWLCLIFWYYSIALLTHPENDLTDDSEAVAIPSACKSKVPQC
jgi:hypothetical protein